jgi:hypothetical protein
MNSELRQVLVLAVVFVVGGVFCFSGCDKTVDQSETTIRYRVHVPDMHCRTMCWPEVAESLLELENVIRVELTEQKGKNRIDNPFVFVIATGTLDNASLSRQLSDWGYENCEIVKQDD